MGLEYPKREKFYAYRVIRMMLKVCAANEIGTDGMALVTAVAMTEDAARYQRAVTFWNPQLMQILGFRSIGQLSRARKRAVEHGWLHYQAGTKSVAGRYFVGIPLAAKEMDDTPIDDGDDDDIPVVFLSKSEQANDKQTISKRDQNDKQTSPFTTNPNPYPEEEERGNSNFEELEFPCQGGKVFKLSESQYENYERTYKTIDVKAELIKAQTWLHSNPTKMKTVGGTTRYLNGWLNKTAKDKENATTTGKNPRPGQFDASGFERFVNG